MAAAARRDLSGCARRNRIPAAASLNGEGSSSASAPDGRRRAGRRMAPRVRVDTKNDAASRDKVAAPPNHGKRKPAAPKPASAATEYAVAIAAVALTSASRGTIVGRNAS